MTNDEEGSRAVQALNNFEFEGRTLTVSQANNPGDRPRREGGPSSFGPRHGGGRGDQGRGGQRFDRGNRF